MAIHFVLIYYLISHCSILAKSFGKETANRSSVLFPDVSNSSLLSITYDNPRPFTSTFRPRSKYVFPNPIQSLSTKQHGSLYNSTRLFNGSLFRPRFPSLSSFVPNVHYHRPNLTTYPRIFHLPSLTQEKALNQFLVTSSPPPLITNSTLSSENVFTTTEAFLPHNLSAQLNLKFTNSQHNQRVVLNSIQEIINSLKNNEQSSGGNKSHNEKVTSTPQGGPNAIKSLPHFPNDTINGKNQSSIFKLRFIEKLKQNENIMKNHLSNFNRPMNSSTSEPRKLHLRHSHPNSLMHHHHVSISSPINSTLPSKMEAPVTKLTSHSNIKMSSSTPSVFKSHTQWMNQLVPFHLMSSNLSTKDFKRKKGSNLINRTSEGDLDESKFMSHIKDLLFRFDNDPNYHASPFLSEKAEYLPDNIPLTLRSSPLMSTNFDTSRIDYGEVERILAYVNPYGRRISMPPSNDFSQAESQTHESRNMRFQRSSPIERWLNDSSSFSFDPATFEQSPANNSNEPVTSDLAARWNSILAFTNQHNSSSADSSHHPEIRPNFKKFDSKAERLSRSESVNKPKHSSDALTKGKKLTYGMRKSGFVVDHQEPNEKDSIDIDFNWANIDQNINNTRSEYRSKKQSKNGTSTTAHSRVGSVRNLTEMAKNPINYNPKDSEFVHYPAPKLVGAEKWRRLNASLFTDYDRDWVNYFSDLEHKMKATREEPQMQTQKFNRAHYGPSSSRKNTSPSPMRIPELSELSPYERITLPIQVKASGRNGDMLGGNRRRPHVKPKFQSLNSEQHYHPVIQTKRRPQFSGVHSNSGSSLIMDHYPSMSEQLNFRLPAPFHLSNVLNYVNEDDVDEFPPPHFPPNMAYYYLPRV